MQVRIRERQACSVPSWSSDASWRAWADSTKPATSPGKLAGERREPERKRPSLRPPVSSLRPPEVSLERSAPSLDAGPTSLGGTSQAWRDPPQAAPGRHKLRASRRRFGTSRGKLGRAAPSLPGEPAPLPGLRRSLPRLRIPRYASPQACREASKAHFRGAQACSIRCELGTFTDQRGFVPRRGLTMEPSRRDKGRQPRISILGAELWHRIP